MYNRNECVIKLLFCVLKRNNFVIKLFLALYSDSIYVEYMYIFVHMFIMNIHINACEYVFSCFPCYWGWKMTSSFWLSPILRFNKAYWLYLQSLLLWAFCNFLSHDLLNVVVDWYMYVYVYFWGRQPRRLTLWFHIFEEN